MDPMILGAGVALGGVAVGMVPTILDHAAQRRRINAITEMIHTAKTLDFAKDTIHEPPKKQE
ncbi:MAG: hypothetical protein WC277_06255 [Bacilli bacterium]